jgi:hypothetical protein
MGSALTQSINSLPTRLVHGDKAAEKFMEERMYKPEQPLAYEYAGDVGNFLEKLETEYKLPPMLPEAVALQYLTGPATSQAMRTAGRGAEQAGRAIERRMEPVVKGALERGGLPREMVMAMGANTQSNVVKPKGGNWLAGSVEKVLDPLIQKGVINNVNIPYGPEFDAAALKRIAELKEAASQPDYTGGAGRVAELLERDINNPRRANEAAMNKWIQSNLTNYVKKDMGTPDDPVRKLADEGISHLPLDTPMPRNMSAIRETRKEAGFPEPYGNSWQGLLYESLADKKIGSGTAGEMINTGKGEPWMDKVDPFTRVHGIPPMESVNFTQDLGFNHIVDVLRQDVAAGRIRPEQLNKVSMEQAVRRTYEYDQEMAKKMQDTALQQQEGFPVHKEYPEGYKWIELAKPKLSEVLPEGWSEPVAKGNTLQTVSSDGKIVLGDSIPEIVKNIYRRHPDTPGNPEQMLEDALKYEGDTMGHCVGGYCPDVLEGRSRIFSLRDAKGEPHVTVEVRPKRGQSKYQTDWFSKQPEEVQDKITQQALAEHALMAGNRTPQEDRFTWGQALSNAIKNNMGEIPEEIIQIKGKGNAKPKDAYLPFVQDFVRGGNWSDVGDFKNTGLDWRTTGPQGIFMQDDVTALEQAGYKVPKYLTTAEKDDLASKLYELQTGKDYKTGLPKEPPAPDVLPDVPPDLEGMKRGGVVISNNPDTMMLELGNKRMKEGGSEDDTKPYFGGAGTKKYAPAKKRAEDADVNLLKDPRTYATVAGFMGERPDEMGFSVLHPDYQGVREAADPAFYAGTALGIAPLGKALNAPFAAIGKALDPAVGRFVTKTMERGGLGADILTDMGQGTRSYVHLPHTEKSPDPTVGTRYKRTDIGGLVPRKDLDIEKLDKSSVKVFPWDASDRNKLVTEVSDIPLTKPVLLEGGDNYMRDIKHVKKRIAGASNEGIANRIQDRIDQASVENQILGGTGKVFGFPIRMADKAEHASTFPTDIAMDLLKQGNLSRKELDDLTNELRGMSFEAKGKGYFQNVAPIDSPEFLVQLREGIKGNKEKGITSVTDMNLRRALMDRLSQKKFQKRLEYNYPDLIGSVIADELKGVPKGWVGNVSAELDPFSKIRPSKSSTYSHDFGGKYYASMPNMPVEFLMPNTFEGIYREMKALYPSAKPEALRNMAIGAMEKRKENISEMIGPRSIDAVKLYQEGLKQGEFDPNDIKQIYDYMRRKKFNLKLENVKKAEGGAVTGDDLIIEERPL